MPRPRSGDKAARLLRAATDTFIERGYRRTQVADVAIIASVGKATVYGYVESKEALFDWALAHADAADDPSLDPLPWPTPAPGRMVARIGERLAHEVREAVLATAFVRGDTSLDELESILADLFERASRNRVAIKLVDRCAVDHPEIAAVWFERGRWAQVEMLAEYLRRGHAAGWLHTDDDLGVASRFAVETIALWAVHRHWDPAPQALDENAVARSVVRLILRGLAGHGGRDE